MRINIILAGICFALGGFVLVEHGPIFVDKQEFSRTMQDVTPLGDGEVHQNSKKTQLADHTDTDVKREAVPASAKAKDSRSQAMISDEDALAAALIEFEEAAEGDAPIDGDLDPLSEVEREQVANYTVRLQPISDAEQLVEVEEEIDRHQTAVELEQYYSEVPIEEKKLQQ